MPNAPSIAREQALAAKPIAVTIVERKKLTDGGERISVYHQPKGMWRWLMRLPEQVKRDYDLDAVGVQVINLCDGQKSVRHIIERFARDHQLDPTEAEQAVTTFLQTLMKRGLVTLIVPKDAP